MGAVINQRPDRFKGIVAQVPFVDVVTTMLDESIPLTTGEFEEWGNPQDETYYRYMKEYSPYDNVEAKAYPHMLVTTGLHDSQVQYWEPAKWVAKLRELKTDDNLLLLCTDMDSGHGEIGSIQILRRVAPSMPFDRLAQDTLPAVCSVKLRPDSVSGLSAAPGSFCRGCYTASADSPDLYPQYPIPLSAVFAEGERRQQRRASGDRCHIIRRPARCVHNIYEQRGGDIAVIQGAVMVQPFRGSDAELAGFIQRHIAVFDPRQRRRASFMVQIHSPGISGSTRRSKLALWATYHGLP